MGMTCSPLRYPGGKSNLSGFVKRLFLENDLCDGEYVEPYCGGAGIALHLLQSQYVSHAHLNDIDPAIHAFWWSVFNRTEELCRRISRVKLSIPTWRRYREILQNPGEHEVEDLGFAAFYLNRVNRSGILTAGPIGGLEQSGEWKMDARFNRKTLCKLVDAAGRYADRVTLTRLDALVLMKKLVGKLPSRSLIYFDPPYVVKGQRLYKNAYSVDDHAAIADCVGSLRSHWLVSYDDVTDVRHLYRRFRYMEYGIGYSANRRSTGNEIMFFSSRLTIPAVDSPVSLERRSRARVA